MAFFRRVRWSLGQIRRIFTFGWATVAIRFLFRILRSIHSLPGSGSCGHRCGKRFLNKLRIASYGVCRRVIRLLTAPKCIICYSQIWWKCAPNWCGPAAASDINETGVSVTFQSQTLKVDRYCVWKRQDPEDVVNAEWSPSGDVTGGEDA